MENIEPIEKPQVWLIDLQQRYKSNSVEKDRLFRNVAGLVKCL
jgi:hypothetical protein